jgi:plasmid maintenance system antidote protein VapI
VSSLDFRRATDLFLGSENELALALDIPPDELRRLRQDPKRASAELMVRLGEVLIERGRGMSRVGEMLREDHAD